MKLNKYLRYTYLSLWWNNINKNKEVRRKNMRWNPNRWSKTKKITRIWILKREIHKNSGHIRFVTTKVKSLRIDNTHT